MPTLQTIIGIGIVALGLAGFIGGQLAVQRSRDRVNSRLDAYVRDQSETYRRGGVDITQDLAMTRERFAGETRFERQCFYAIHFGGMLLMFWGASRLRRGQKSDERLST